MTIRVLCRHIAVTMSFVVVLTATRVLASESNEPTLGAITASFLQNLEQHGHKLRIIENSSAKGTNRKWASLLEFTFPIGLSFNTCSRVVFQDESIKLPLALFVFDVPKGLNKAFPSFYNLSIRGTLRSEALTYYQVVSNYRFFALILSEQHELHLDNPAVAQLLTSLQSEIDRGSKNLRGGADASR